MNAANLQLEGLYLAVAAVNNLLVGKGVISREELDLALRTAEASATSEDRLVEEFSPASRDAVAFPIRLLLIANNSEDGEAVPSFSELARMVGETKPSYNDQQ